MISHASSMTDASKQVTILVNGMAAMDSAQRNLGIEVRTCSTAIDTGSVESAEEVSEMLSRVAVEVADGYLDGAVIEIKVVGSLVIATATLKEVV